jgi:ABC-2 type transport system ATP-binding protein
MITFEHVDKHFSLQHQKTLKEMVQAFVGKKKLIDEVKALNNVNFIIKKGESVAIIGKNGAGKSTALKLIAGVSAPSRGKVKIEGKVAPLIELGAGFHPELTGGENIILNCVILGLSEREAKELFPAIVEFSELQDFIEVPVKYYSSGMYARLAFSVAIHAKGDILLVDEILGVGDSDFQEKCLKQMHAFKEEGKTIVLVTHASSAALNFCERAIYLEKGCVKFDGDIKEAFNHYHAVADIL